MPKFPLLVDVSLSPETVQQLSRQGWDVIRATDRLPANTPDLDLLQLARRERRVVITHDLDFSALLALSGHRFPSLITLRLHNTDPTYVTAKLLQHLPEIEEHLIEGCAVTIEDTSFRIRKLPIE